MLSPHPEKWGDAATDRRPWSEDECCRHLDDDRQPQTASVVDCRTESVCAVRVHIQHKLCS